MTVIEQNILKEKAYKEAMRYIANANENLKKAKKDGKYYQDVKYVKTACVVAYCAVLHAMDCIFVLNDIPKTRKRKDVGYYQDNMAKINKKLLNNLNNVYSILHLSGYYDGITKVSVIQSGIEEALDIINVIKPNNKN